MEFALDGWTGVAQDHWDQSPRLKIYAIREQQVMVKSCHAEDFAKREGLELDLSFLEKDDLEASIRLLSQANNKDYLPDLVGLPAEDNPPEWLGDFYIKMEQAPHNDLSMYCVYIRKNPPYSRPVKDFSIISVKPNNPMRASLYLGVRLLLLSFLPILVVESKEAKVAPGIQFFPIL